MSIETTHRQRRLRVLCVRISWNRYVHTYHDGSRRYVNQWHFVRDKDAQ